MVGTRHVGVPRACPRRRLLAASAAAAALIGCRGAGQLPRRDTPAQPTAAVKLAFWKGGSTAQTPLFEALFEEYRAQRPLVSFDLTSITGTLQEHRAKLITATAGGVAPDIFISDGPWLPEFATKGILARAPAEVQQDLAVNFTDGGQRYASYKGVVYGYPFDSVVHGLYYNRELFVQAGLDPDRPPRSFAEFRDAARRIARWEGEQFVQAGFVANPRLLYVENFVYNNGGRVINENEYGDLQRPYRLTLDTPQALAALQLHYDMHNVDRSASVQQRLDFLQGKVGMLITTNGYVVTLKQQAPELAIRTTTLPTNLDRPRHQLGGWMWGVHAQGQSGPAWDFVRFANTKEAILRFVVGLNQVSTHKAVIADPRVLQVDPRVKVFYDVLPTITHVRPKAVTWSEIEALVEPEMERMFAGDLSPRELVEKVRGPVEALLAQEP